MIFARHIFFFSLTGILFGLAVTNWHSVNLALGLTLFFLGLALFGLGFYYQKSKWLFLLSALLGGLIFGFWRSSLLVSLDYTRCDIGEITLQGQVKSESTDGDFYQRLNFQADQWSEKILVSLPRDQEFKYGDRLIISGLLRRPSNFMTDQGREFDYQRYLAKDNVLCLLTAKQVQKIDDGSNLVTPFFKLKTNFLLAISRALPEPESTLLGGLVLGAKSGLDQDLKQAYTKVGLSHILVLSGYNISLVAAALTGVSLIFGSVLSFIFTTLGLAIFVFVSGGGAAAVRAGIMGVIAVLARSLGRPNKAGLVLLLTATIMVLLNPRLLNFDLGFQLSFLATMGIVYGPAMFKPRVERILKSNFWSETLVTTLGALVFTWPWLAYATGQVSLVALPANLLVVPLVSPLMWAGLALGALGLVSSFLALLFAWPIHLVLSLQIYLVWFFAAWPLAEISLGQFSFLWLLIFYGPIIYWAIRANKKSNQLARAIK